MKNVITLLFLILILHVFAGAQNAFPEIEIAGEIKLLKSTRSDVKTIMSEFDSDNEAEEEADEEDQSYADKFTSDKATVTVFYSTGKCSGEEDFEQIPEWNAPKMTVTKVVITFDEDPNLKDLGLNLSSFKKRLRYEDSADDEDSIFSNDFIYYDENAGIVIVTDNAEVEKIIIHPPKKQIGYLCSNENNKEILSGKTKFIDSVVEGRFVCYLRNIPTNVTKLDLKTNGFFGCKDEKCLDAKKEITVTTTAVDVENDQLVYNYIVSGGKIDGSGAVVTWNLAGVLPGTYTITAGADDGCGICGETQTRKIFVKENSYEVLYPPKIKELVLDKTELIAGCPVGRLRRISCPAGSCAVSVASVSESKNLTYRYEVGDGEIIGSGDKIVWDLSGLKPGEYSIRVSASSDGTDFGDREERTVVIKENPDCTAPKK